MDTGLGKGGYSIISQGQIGSIVNNSAMERKLLIEEAVGIVKYKARKGEALRKLEKTQNDLYRVSDILSDLSQRLPSLKRQSEKARTYLDIREELKGIEINLFVHKYEELRDKLDMFQADEKAINAKLCLLYTSFFALHTASLNSFVLTEKLLRIKGQSELNMQTWFTVECGFVL